MDRLDLVPSICASAASPIAHASASRAASSASTSRWASSTPPSSPTTTAAAESDVIGARRSSPNGPTRTTSVPITPTQPPCGRSGVPKPPGRARSAISFPVTCTRNGLMTRSARRWRLWRVVTMVMAPLSPGRRERCNSEE